MTSLRGHPVPSAHPPPEHVCANTHPAQPTTDMTDTTSATTDHGFDEATLRLAARIDAALAEHRPLGDVQRARKVVYFESQKGRGAA